MNESQVEKFNWTDEFSVNSDVLDYEHQALLQIYSEMVDVVENNGSNLKMADLLSQLADYAMTHFRTEEAYMESISYPKLDAHRLLHSQYSEQVLKFTLDYMNRDPAHPRAILLFLKNWWTGHILKVDSDYAKFAANLPADRG